MNKEICKDIFRYVVPFRFNRNYEECIKKISEREMSLYPSLIKIKNIEKTWELVDVGNDESDLYDYIKNEFVFDEELDNDNKIGFEFKSISEMPKLYWFDKDFIEFKLKNFGLYLFRNGLGFIWYEVDLSNLYNDIDSIIKFQNKFRELNHNPGTGGVGLWAKADEEDKCITYKKGKENLKLVPVSMGDWVNSILVDTFGSKVEYVASRKNNFYSSSITKRISALDKMSTKYEYTIEEACVESDVIDNKGNKKIDSLTKAEVLQRKEGDYAYVPDKAVLFTYICTEAKDKLEDTYIDEDKRQVAYHLTNGYKESYIYSPKIGESIYQPFGNVTWFATSEGASMISWPYDNPNDKSDPHNNLEFFKGTFPKKVEGDYFHIFIKILYQSYSLLLFSEEVQDNLSAIRDVYSEVHDNKANKEEIERNREEINKLSININLFLTKNVTSSISHIDHQNVFYNYVLKALRVDEESESVLTGLTALNEFVAKQNEEDLKKYQEEDEKKDAKTSAIIGFLAVFEALSAISDWEEIYEEGFKVIIHDVGTVLITIIAIVSLYVACVEFKKAFFKK